MQVTSSQTRVLNSKPSAFLRSASERETKRDRVRETDTQRDRGTERVRETEERGLCAAPGSFQRWEVTESKRRDGGFRFWFCFWFWVEPPDRLLAEAGGGQKSPGGQEDRELD